MYIVDRVSAIIMILVDIAAALLLIVADVVIIIFIVAEVLLGRLVSAWTHRVDQPWVYQILLILIEEVVLIRQLLISLILHAHVL